MFRSNIKGIFRFIHFRFGLFTAIFSIPLSSSISLIFLALLKSSFTEHESILFITVIGFICSFFIGLAFSIQRVELINKNQKLNKKHTEVINLEKKVMLDAIKISYNHEIRNPLMIIHGNASILLKKNENQSEVKRIIEGCDRISNILKQISNIEDPDLAQYSDSSKMLKLSS